MHYVHAYALGAQQKLAEQDIDPVFFVHEAIRTQDPGALKIASALVAYEKYASAGSRTVKLLTGTVAPPAAKATAQVLPHAPAAPAVGRVRARWNQFRGALHAGGAGRASAKKFLGEHADYAGKGFSSPQMDEMARGAKQIVRDQNIAMGGIAAAPVVAGGAAYGMTDANTAGNAARRLSNTTLGTNLRTKSKFRNALGG